MGTRKIKYETPQTLYNRYPEVQLLGWNVSRIGVLLNAYLLHGLPKEKRRLALVDERSFQALIKFSGSVFDEHKAQTTTRSVGLTELVTPTELIEEYEDLVNLGWTPTKIGIFLSCKLLVGCQNGVGRSCLITRGSLLRLVDHANGTSERRKVILLR